LEVKTDDSCFHTAFETDNNRKRCVSVCACVCMWMILVRVIYAY